MGNQIRLSGISILVVALGTIMFSFSFRSREYSVMKNIVRGPTSLILLKKLDKSGLNYHTVYNVIERPEDGYCLNIEMRNYISFIIFPENIIF